MLGYLIILIAELMFKLTKSAIQGEVVKRANMHTNVKYNSTNTVTLAHYQ